MNLVNGLVFIMNPLYPGFFFFVISCSKSPTKQSSGRDESNVQGEPSFIHSMPVPNSYHFCFVFFFSFNLTSSKNAFKPGLV